MPHNYQNRMTNENILITGCPGVGYTTVARDIAYALSIDSESIERVGSRPAEHATSTWTIDLNTLAYRIDDEQKVFYGFGQNYKHIMNLPFDYIFYLYVTDFDTYLERAERYRTENNIQERQDTWKKDSLMTAIMMNLTVELMKRKSKFDLRILPVNADKDPVPEILSFLAYQRKTYMRTDLSVVPGYDIMREESTELAEALAKDDSYDEVGMEYLDTVFCLKLIENPEEFIEKGYAKHLAKCQAKGYDTTFQKSFIKWLDEKGYQVIKQFKERRKLND